jgi:Mannosyltransferase putative
MSGERAGMKDAESDRREATARMLAEIPDLPRREYSGRGIVICAGGVQLFTNAWVLVWMLRKVLNCALPIEVWHLGASEMSSGMRDMLEGLGAKVVDAFAVLPRFPARIADGWQLKPYALIMSPFREVLLLDADNVPVTDPTFLFERPEFTKAGAVFWPDVLDIAADNPVWDEFGLQATRRASFETGQILLDKTRHGAALKVALRLNEDAERYYKLIYGDKDTFLVAWVATGSDFRLVPHRPLADRYVTYQRDFDGNVVFQHRSNAKWRYGGEQSRPDAFVHEAACEEALTELRRIWNGRIFEPPVRSLAARRMEQLMENRSLLATCPGEEDRELELLPGHQIGRGRDYDRETWTVAELEPGRFVLRILDRRGVRYELRQRDDDSWMESKNPDAAMVLTCADRARGGGSVALRDFAFVRDLIEAVLADGSWTEGVADELRITFTALCKVDRRLADEVADYAAADRAMDDATRAGIREVAAELKRSTAGLPPRQKHRSPVELLSDRRYYVRP